MSELYDEHAWVYDAAFSWDVTEEVEWLLGRLGPGTSSVLEPFCGTGRMIPPFAARGVEMAGVDLSEGMLEVARERLKAGGDAEPNLLWADVTDFDFGRTFDGAICPVNSFAHLLTRGAALAHLDRVARHLPAGARYLVQLDLRTADLVPLDGPQDQGKWTVDDPRGRIDALWYVREVDAAREVESHVSRFEVLDGPRAGLVVEDVHLMRRWEWETFSGLLADSPFVETAAFDGNRGERPELPVGPGLNGGQLLWHELTRRAM